MRSAGFGCVPWDVWLMIAEEKRHVDAMTVKEYQSKPTATPRATTIINPREVNFELHDHEGLLPLPSPKIDEVLPIVPDCEYILAVVACCPFLRTKNII